MEPDAAEEAGAEYKPVTLGDVKKIYKKLGLSDHAQGLTGGEVVPDPERAAAMAVEVIAEAQEARGAAQALFSAAAQIQPS